MIAAIAVVAGDLLTPRKRIQTISALYFGVIVGHLPEQPDQRARSSRPCSFTWTRRVHMAIPSVLMIFICYICISTLLQTKDDFRFIIPYVEFSKEVKGARPLVLDTSVVIDGRIADVAETRVHRPAAGRPAVRAPGAAEHRRQLRQAPPQPGPARAGHPQPAPEIAGHRGPDPRRRDPRAGRHPRGRSAAGRPGQAPGRQGRHQRLQPQQDRPAPGRRGHQPQRPGQRHEADRPARREPDGQAASSAARSRARASATSTTARWSSPSRGPTTWARPCG